VDSDSSAIDRGAEQCMAAPLPLLTREIPVRTTVVQIRWDWSLRHQNDEVGPFLLTMCIGFSNRDRTTSSGLLFCSWSMASSPDEAPVLFSLPMVVEALREASPGLGLAWVTVKWCNRCRGAAPRVWPLRQKFKGHRPLFIGILALDHSRGAVLTILSLTKLDLAIVREKSK
jgi:hypothetical protein